MKVLLISSFVFFALIASIQSQNYLPCVSCARGGPEVCAKPTTNEGPVRTFENSCLVQAMDCGHTEHRKRFTAITIQFLRSSLIKTHFRVHDPPRGKM